MIYSNCNRFSNSMKNIFIYSIILVLTSLSCLITKAQQNSFLPIPLPLNISETTEEYSGLAAWNNRLYLLPQYGDHKKVMMYNDFFIYSISLDSIGLVIDGKIPALTHYRTIRVNNLDYLPNKIKKTYKGFEAISIVNGTVYMSIESPHIFDNCYILKGTLDTAKNEVTIDMDKIITLKRQYKVFNAGFESLTYIPTENKLLALFEAHFPNGNNQPKGYLIDTSFTKTPELIDIPPVYFRITDIAFSDKIYAINYYWSYDHPYYADGMEKEIMKSNRELAPFIEADPLYLQRPGNSYARIISLNNLHDKKWNHVYTFDCDKNNWEGLVMFRKGALVISDANRNAAAQVTTLAYLPLFE